MFTIALNTFREIIRSRYFSLIFLFGIILFVGIFFFNTLALNQSQFIVFDFWLSFIEITGIFVILFLGNRMLSREFEEKTIYLTLSRPIARGKIIFGKFFGFSWILGISLIIQSIFLIIIIKFFGLQLTEIFFWSLLGIFFKQLSILAIILFFSIFLSSSISTFLALATYIIGHSGYALLEYAKNNENQIFDIIGNGILFFFPNLQALNIKNLIHHNEIIGMHLHLTLIFLSASLYIFIVLLLSQYIFQRKNFDSI